MTCEISGVFREGSTSRPESFVGPESSLTVPSLANVPHPSPIIKSSSTTLLFGHDSISKSLDLESHLYERCPPLPSIAIESLLPSFLLPALSLLSSFPPLYLTPFYLATVFPRSIRTFRLQPHQRLSHRSFQVRRTKHRMLLRRILRIRLSTTPAWPRPLGP